MNIIFICKICSIEFKNSHSLSNHLKIHKISSENYYKQYLLKPGEGLCKICGNATKYHSLTQGFRQYCSNACLSKDNNVVLKRDYLN